MILFSIGRRGFIKVGWCVGRTWRKRRDGGLDIDTQILGNGMGLMMIGIPFAKA